jgi:hypothetical protein
MVLDVSRVQLLRVKQIHLISSKKKGERQGQKSSRVSLKLFPN